MQRRSVTVSLAGRESVGEVFALYSSLIGVKGCVWNEYYPTKEDVALDADTGDLYVLREGGVIVGAAAAGNGREDDVPPLWKIPARKPCSLSRVGIANGYRGKGLAKTLVAHIESDALRRGFDAMRLLAFKDNPAAVALYRSLGYKQSAEAELFDIGLYIFFEKALG